MKKTIFDKPKKVRVTVPVTIEIYNDGKFYFDSQDVADEIIRKLLNSRWEIPIPINYLVYGKPKSGNKK